VSFQSLDDGVSHDASCIAVCKFNPPSRPEVPAPVELWFGVGHPVKPLSDVCRARARSAQIGRPEGVALIFHISVNKVEPSQSVLARNLFAKNDWRPALADEMMEGWPQVPLISKPAAFACRAERLTGAGSGPNWPIIWQSLGAEGGAPGANTGEEMTLGIPRKFIWFDVFNGPFIHFTTGYQPSRHEIAQPGGAEPVIVVVIHSHRF
jgi:hypothetical protein